MRLQDENKKEAIFEASIKLVNEIGFVSASVAKIAKEANVSPATIYIYHKNKEDLLISIYIEIKQKLSKEMLVGFDENNSIKEALKRIWLNAFDYIKKHRNYFMFTEQFSNSPYSDKVDKEKINESFLPFIKMFEKGMNEGVLKKVSFEVLSVFGFWPVMILSNEKICSGFKDSPEEINQVFEMAWDAIKK